MFEPYNSIFCDPGQVIDVNLRCNPVTDIGYGECSVLTPFGKHDTPHFVVKFDDIKIAEKGRFFRCKMAHFIVEWSAIDNPHMPSSDLPA